MLYILVVNWEDETRRAVDHETPFLFGPYTSSELADSAADHVRAYSVLQPEPDKLSCRVAPLMHPDVLSKFFT